MRGLKIATAIWIGVVGCRSDAPVELQPDALLRDSLGLTDADVVYAVQLRAEGMGEVAEPARTTILPDAWVSFHGGDARGHVIRFDTVALGERAREWIRASDQVESPPLLTPASRWVVSFAHAPEGDYPFTVEGGGTPGVGRIEIRGGGG